MVTVFKNAEERSAVKNYHPVSLLSVVSKVFEKLNSIRNRMHLEQYNLFSNFQYVFKSSQSTVDLLSVLSDRMNC